MRAIFLSYRRDDAEGEAGRLFDDLISEFGVDKVFMDVAGIEPGRDFRKVIDQNVASCGVLLAMIGKGWIDAKDDAGRRRLDDPVDFVRLETASALRRDIPVIPVLVHGGRMPRAEQLPEDLKDLAYRNAVELTHARWDSDVQVLIKALCPNVSGAREEAGGKGTELVLDRRSAKSTARVSQERVVGGASSAAPTRPTKKSWRRIVVPVVAAVVITAGVLGMYEYKKAEEAKVRQAAAEAAANQAAEDQRAATEREAARRAAERQTADQAAATRAAVDQAAIRNDLRKKQEYSRQQSPNEVAYDPSAAADEHSGTWKMNAAKTIYSPGPAPKELTLKIESDQNHIKINGDGTNANGTPLHVEYDAKFDGKDYPATGIGDADTMSAKRLPGGGIETQQKKGGKVMGTITSVVSKDGKTRTSTWKGKGAQGRDINNVVVFDKQKNLR